MFCLLQETFTGSVPYYYIPSNVTVLYLKTRYFGLEAAPKNPIEHTIPDDMWRRFQACWEEPDTRSTIRQVVSDLNPVVSALDHIDIPLFELTQQHLEDAECLFAAVRKGDLVSVSLLLARGVDVNTRDKYGYTALHKACMRGRRNIAEELLISRAYFLATGPNGLNALHFAAGYGHGEVIKLLLKKWNMAIEARNPSGYTALHWASQCGEIAAVETLINSGADFEAADEKGETSLMKAVIGADPAAREPEKPDKTPQFCEVIRALLRAGSPAEFRCNRGETALHFACIYGIVELIEVILDEADEDEKATLINQKVNDEHAFAPLHLAILWNRLDVVKTLLKLGADKEIRSANGQTPLHFAAGSTEIYNDLYVQLLFEHGADGNAVDYDGHTLEYFSRR
jgi:ankyrin repeat protein